MAQTLIPKTIDLDENEIKEIKEKFPFLTDNHIKEIRHWNSPGSPYSGTIVDESAQFLAYPYPSHQSQFLTDYLDGEIYEK